MREYQGPRTGSPPTYPRTIYVPLTNPFLLFRCNVNQPDSVTRVLETQGLNFLGSKGELRLQYVYPPYKQSDRPKILFHEK